MGAVAKQLGEVDLAIIDKRRALKMCKFVIDTTDYALAA